VSAISVIPVKLFGRRFASLALQNLESSTADIVDKYRRSQPITHTMAESAPAYDPFFNVRRGGPKEKRIRRVELMGEHKPKPIYYIKAVQSLNDELLTDDVLRNYFENRYDFGCDICCLRSL
jgi:hypothetical protein